MANLVITRDHFAIQLIQIFVSSTSKYNKVIITQIDSQWSKGLNGWKLSGRYIRQTYDNIKEIKIQNKNDLIISVDFEKAFYKIDWDFIMQIQFNLGSSLYQWISKLQKGANLVKNSTKWEFFSLYICTLC